MPIYEYSCKKCHHQFELMRRLSDTSLPSCPACQDHDVDRLVSAAGFQLKGTGWYATDFKSKKSESPKTETSSEKKVETKQEKSE